MGIASNISIPALGVLMRASVALPRSQCFLLQETNSEKSPLKYSVCHQISVCHRFVLGVTWCYFYVKYLLGQYSCRQCEI